MAKTYEKNLLKFHLDTLKDHQLPFSRLLFFAGGEQPDSQCPDHSTSFRKSLPQLNAWKLTSLAILALS